ncbi:hypothetical protein AK812_SmicGene1086 [Symbiodinium microadriaticum]|uniref:Uncharacterized protein n=1 Tax=Symbiodinium microadriaticum TaxID=2951 RepID=A0A1Q9F505_SYMMI|nr:hypothetical protein AK812_SmicGene1086 [Symbiodinium microadriaticum]
MLMKVGLEARAWRSLASAGAPGGEGKDLPSQAIWPISDCSEIAGLPEEVVRAFQQGQLWEEASSPERDPDTMRAKIVEVDDQGSPVIVREEEPSARTIVTNEAEMDLDTPEGVQAAIAELFPKKDTVGVDGSFELPCDFATPGRNWYKEWRKEYKGRFVKKSDLLKKKKK